MGLFSFLGAISPVHIHWVTLVTGARKIGTDQQGNRYFTAPARAGYKLERRWVMYRGTAEASKVPPEWHGWLHHQTNDIPDSDTNSYRRNWQKPHVQNMTGTNAAYRPPGHILSGGQRDAATGDYEPWVPDQIKKNSL